MPAPHRLLSARRTVATQALPAYGRAWARVRAAADAADVHAWLFRTASPGEPTSYLEFLEWSAAAGDATAAPELSRALAALEAAFPGSVERWEEVSPLDFLREGAP